MHMHRCGVPAHKAGGAWVLFAGLGFAAIVGTQAASAQTTPPPAGAAGKAPSEALLRQANSPYRFILQNANAPSRAKPAPPSPAPAAVEAKKPAKVEQAAVTRPVPAPEPAPASIQAAPAPAIETPPAPAAEPVAAIPSPPEPVVAVRREVIPVQTDDPRLPAALLREHPSGIVRVAFELNPDGSTGNVKVVSSTNRALNRASVDAVSNWKFMPVDEVLSIETELAYKFD